MAGRPDPSSPPRLVRWIMILTWRRTISGAVVFLALLILVSVGRAETECLKEIETTCQVMDPGLFTEERLVVIVPFSPGERVRADEHSERAALMMVKGFADLFHASSRVRVAGSDQAGEADLVIEGTIDDMAIVHRWRRWIGLRPRARFRARGRAVTVGSSKTVAVFEVIWAGHALTGRGEGSLDRIAYEMGRGFAGCLLREKTDIAK